ncbi:hypothetical protein HY469_04015 [Candidatus Roizmanbacteria bacterium]|nr:hypothetical protein [Candidatus Roizmanbacteria bacterium]
MPGEIKKTSIPPKKKRNWKKIILISFGIFLVLVVLGNRKKKQQVFDTPETSSAREESVSVPAEYAALYEELERELQSFEQTLPEPTGNNQIIFGAELLTANTHRGEELLTDQALPGNFLMLDRLVSLGVEGVSVSLQYPILLSSYPRSQEYWNFYRKLVSEIRKRKLTLHMDIGPVFTNPEYSSIRPNYLDLTKEEYLAGKKEIAVRIVHELQPDYLTLVNEPSTESEIIGFDISAQENNRFITDVAQEVSNNSVLLGAGSGTWESISYIELYVKNPDVDYIDLHIYPITNGITNYLDQAVAMAQIAHAQNKKVIIGEVWLYKASATDLVRGASHPSIFARDTYSFFAPLDQKMLDVIDRMSQSYDISYISPFWSRYFFGYVPYESNRNKSDGQLLLDANKASVENLLSGTPTSTGSYYQKLISK